MNNLLSLDTKFVSKAVCAEEADHAYAQQKMRVHVFVRGDYTSSDRQRGDLTTSKKVNSEQPVRVVYHYEPIDAEAQVRAQLETAVGRTIIAGE